MGKVCTILFFFDKFVKLGCGCHAALVSRRGRLNLVMKRTFALRYTVRILGKAIRTNHVAAVSSSVVRNGSKGTLNAFAVPFYRRIM